MNDTIGLIYDDEAAVHFAHKATGLDEATVAAILKARDRYQVGLGVYAAEVLEGVESPEQIRAAHPDLFFPLYMKRRYVDPVLEREYIVRELGIDEPSVRAVISADVEYMRKRGIIGRIE